jgi:cytochrome c peroxidase
VGRGCGAFKVPTLRNIAITAPYFHNGAFDTLADALRFYATRDTDPGRWYPALADGGVDRFDDLPAEYRANVNVKEVPYDRHPGEQPRLSDDDLTALEAFLETLTDR